LPILVLIGGLTLVVSFLEAFNIGLLVPLLETLAAPREEGGHWISRLFADIFDAVGVPLQLGSILAILGAVILIMGLLKYLRMILMAKAHESFTAWVRSKYMWTLLRADMSYFHRQNLGTLTDNVTNQATHAGAVLFGTAELFTAAGVVTAFLVAALLIQPALTGVAVAMLVAVTLAMQYFIAQGREIGAVSVAKHNRLQSSAVENLSGIHVIKSFLLEMPRWNYFSSRAQDVMDINYRRERNISRMTVFQEMSVFVVIGAIIYVGIEVMGLEIAVIVALLFTLYRLAPRVSALNTARLSLVTSAASLRQVQQVMGEPAQPKVVSGTRVFEGLQDAIQLRAVSFSFNGSAEVLNNADFRIDQGKMTAIVGASGAGKTTIVDLILRHYDPIGGQMLVDGVDLRELDLASWRRAIGVVSQDNFLFNDTVSNNIALGRDGVTSELVVDAAKRAYAHEFVQELPQGYETPIGDRGWNLSGGQRQRLALARAILLTPEILILDEATSALDSESERMVQKYINEIRGTCTLVVVAHRMATIRAADKIVVLQDGKILEQGDWDSLAAGSGVFAAYQKLQADG